MKYSIMKGRGRRTLIAILLLVSSSQYVGCGSYEYRQRPDGNGEVAVLRSIEDIYPAYASSFKLVADGIKLPEGLDSSIAHIELKNEITKLYQAKDQLNAQLRDFVVAMYQSYINSELDPKESARLKGRTDWQKVVLKVQEQALQVRKIKDQVDEKARRLEDTVQKSKKDKLMKEKKRAELIEEAAKFVVLEKYFTEKSDDQGKAASAAKAKASLAKFKEAVSGDMATKATEEAKHLEKYTCHVTENLPADCYFVAGSKSSQSFNVVDMTGNWATQVFEVKKSLENVAEAEKDLQKNVGMAIESIYGISGTIAKLE